MFKIKGNDFHVTRGDAGSFNIQLDDYTFKTTDILKLNIYREYGMDSAPVKTVTLTFMSETDVATMTLNGSDTLLGSPVTERETYWYEITLNDVQTPFCYDENGPKYFYIYPGGVN